MPKWNTSNVQVQDYLISIATYYIREFDIDGWRLDVSDEISHDFWRRFRKEIKAAKESAVIIGENWHNASNYLRGDQYDSIMNYAFTKAALDYFAYGQLDAQGMANKLNDILARNTDTVNDMMLNLLDSHDTDRFFSEVHEDRKKLKAALALLYLFPGAPSIFYGTECYTVGGYDPDCRRCMDFAKDKEDTLNDYIKQLADIRKKCSFQFSGTHIFASEDKKLFCLKRQGRNGDVMLYINESESIGKKRYSGSTWRLQIICLWRRSFMKGLKNAFALLLISSLGVCMTACGSDNVKQVKSAADSANGEVITLRILENDTAKQEGYLDELLSAFNEAYKDKGIQAVDTNMEEYSNLAENGPYGYGPDVLYQANDKLMAYAEDKHILALNRDDFE